MAKNVYIHIPFCRGKCHYCSFVSFDKLELKGDYLPALKKQIKTEYKCEKLNTLYFGGGTPSLLTIDEIQSLINLFNFEKDAEITVEVNPDDVELNYLKGIKQIGVNRLSIGSQTFNDEFLKIIGRIHNSAQILSALNCAKKAGFKNISLDLIYGLPKQDLKSFEADLRQAINLDIQHISLYGLKIEEGCYFYKRNPQNLPDLDIQADMYLKAVEVLKNAGFKHYEVSNFTFHSQHKAQNLKLGEKDIYPFESRHNLNYWNNNTYYGFGCSASGYLEGIRYTNQIDLEKYIQNPLAKISEQKLSEQEILEEAIFLGFRKIAGINIEEINQKFRIDFRSKYRKILSKYQEFFVKTNNGYALNLNGILISNEILAEFISD